MGFKSRPARIAQIPASTPADPGDSGSRSRALPDDLLREASRRLSVVGFTSGAIWIVATLLGHLTWGAMSSEHGIWAPLLGSDVISLIAGVISLGLGVYARRSRRNPRFLLDLGLVFLVFTSLALGLLMHWDPPPQHIPIFPMLSWIGVAVVMFAALAPNRPLKTFWVGLVAVSMNPLSMLLARARGTWHFEPAGMALVMHYPDYLLVGVAVVISRVFTRLGQQVSRAREMGSYQLGEPLGGGGMGQVYRATHRMLARPAAIKLIRPETLGAPEGEAARRAVQRFRREAEAAASLRSPHTVELYDFGVTDDGTFFCVMELLEGEDLETLVRRTGPLPAARVAHVLRQALESLEEAHARGLVHRDIKPANLHLGRLGLRHDFVKVLDFGLVKSLTDTTAGESLATVEGITPGTPAYMAPEMVRGESVDGRADLYALGCVAYFLLTGQLVFPALNGLEMITKHLVEAPEPPSRRGANDLPPGFERLVLDCLAKDPAARPCDAAEVARRLAALDLPPWGEEEARRWWAAHGPAQPAGPAPAAG